VFVSGSASQGGREGGWYSIERLSVVPWREGFLPSAIEHWPTSEQHVFMEVTAHVTCAVEYFWQVHHTTLPLEPPLSAASVDGVVSGNVSGSSQFALLLQRLPLEEQQTLKTLW
jgi:hypothetical protein